MNSSSLLAAAAILFAGSDLFGATVFFSTSAFGQGASLANPTLTLTLNDAPVDLHVYFVPDAGDAAYLGISFGVTSTTAGVAAITAFSVLNPVISVGGIPIDDRWNATGGSLVSPDELSNMSGVSVNRAGLDPANDGSGVFLDEGYDSSASAYYFGVVTVAPVRLGSTNLHLTVGSAGIARSGDTPQPVGPTAPLTFGASEPSVVLGDDFGSSGTIFDAQFNVIPEPATAVLVGMGLFLGFIRRRPRS